MNSRKYIANLKHFMFIVNIMCLLWEFPDVLECTVPHAVEKISPDERDEMKVSGKV